LRRRRDRPCARTPAPQGARPQGRALRARSTFARSRRTAPRRRVPMRAAPRRARRSAAARARFEADAVVHDVSPLPTLDGHHGERLPVRSLAETEPEAPPCFRSPADDHLTKPRLFLASRVLRNRGMWWRLAAVLSFLMFTSGSDAAAQSDPSPDGGTNAEVARL